MLKSLLSMMLSLMLMLTPMMALAQTSTTPSTSSKSVTLTGDELAEVVDRACGAARKKAEQASDLRRLLEDVQTERDRLAGQVEMLRDVDALRIEAIRQREVARMERDAKWSTLTVVLVFAGAFALGGVGGWAVGQF